MRRLTRLAPVLALALLTGCAVGPGYHRPEVDIPPQHRGAPADTVAPSLADSATRSIADLQWFDAFQDTTLKGLIGQALAGNHDLRIAAARVTQARAQAGIVASALWPWFGLQGSAQRQQISEDVIDRPGDQITNYFDAGAAVSWEVDVFGRIRRETWAARAEARAAEYDRRGVVQSLVAEVAAQYFTLRELDERLIVARATLESRRGTLDLFTKRYKGGVASRLETSQAEADLRATAAAIPNLERQIAITENAIQVLLGRSPGPVPREPLVPSTPEPRPVPAGLPSQLLERRPDVCAAEERLRAANDRVGAATAQYFPTISLTGFLGGQTRDLSSLTNPGAAAWSLAGGILQPLFQGGRIRKLNQAARADWEATAETYLVTAQRSFQETADALVTVVKLREAVVEQERRVDALSVGLRLAKSRYEGGLSSYLEVLDADRQLYAGANDLAGARGDLQRSYVQLYRALGGGWDADVTPAAGGAAAE